MYGCCGALMSACKDATSQRGYMCISVARMSVVSAGRVGHVIKNTFLLIAGGMREIISNASIL